MRSSRSSSSTHARFLPRITEADILYMQRTIAQELHIYDDQMLSSRLFYLSTFVKDVWKRKAEAIKNGEIYIGG